MTAVRRLAAASSTAVTVLLAVGCASSGSASSAPSAATPTPTALTAAGYRAALHQVAQEEAAAQQQVQSAFHAHSVAQVRRALAAFAADQRRAASRVGDLRPPSNAVAANDELAHAFSDNARAVASLVTKLAGTKTVKQALGTIQRDRSAQRVGREIDAALTKLKKLGYTSGS